MKKLRAFGLLLVALALGFALVACQSGAGDDEGGGSLVSSSQGRGNRGPAEPGVMTFTNGAYTIKIWQNTARYVAQNGDFYEISLRDGTVISKGTVDVNKEPSGAIIITFKPDEPSTPGFKATLDLESGSLAIQGGPIKGIDGKTHDIPTLYEDGGGDENEQGTVTITGIPSEFNGKYVGFLTDALEGDTPDASFMLVGAQSVTISDEEIEVTLVQISGGQASVPVWILFEDDSFDSYYGNDSVAKCIIAIMDAETLTFDEEEPSFLDMQVISVSFSNGSATISWTSEPSGGGEDTITSLEGKYCDIGYDNDHHEVVHQDKYIDFFSDGTFDIYDSNPNPYDSGTYTISSGSTLTLTFSRSTPNQRTLTIEDENTLSGSMGTFKKQ